MQNPTPIPLGGMTREALTDWAAERGASAPAAHNLACVLAGRFAGRQSKKQTSRTLLAAAEAAFCEARLPLTCREDNDGTQRFVVQLSDESLVETVAIFHKDRTTLCLSTQVGCARACVFCETGRLGLVRNLAAWEITSQFAAAALHLKIEGLPTPTNLVFMGMGEPLDNLDAVLLASEVLADDAGFSIPMRRITVSTVGIVPKMHEFYARARCNLAVSLHAANDPERQRLLPAARKWNLATLRETLAASPRTILLQWTLIEGINDTDRHMQELIAFCRDLNVRLNLIPLNPGPMETMRPTPMPRVRILQEMLMSVGIRTMVRMPHGQDVGAACGQLAGSRRSLASVQK